MLKRNLIIMTLFIALLAGVSFAERTEEPWKVYGVDSPMTKLMSKYYNTTEIKVVSVGQDMHYTDDVSVCFYLSNATGTDVFKIRDMRVKAHSWMTIMKALKFQPSRLFTPVGGYTVPKAYSHAYREYYNWNSNRDYQMKIYDKEVRNLVQLKFMVKRFGSSPMEIMNQITKGGNFTGMILKKIK